MLLEVKGKMGKYLNFKGTLDSVVSLCKCGK